MYIKIFKKKYQEKWENAYLRVENARAPRALSRALDPGQYWLASLARLHFAMSARSRENFWPPPPDQILDPLLQSVIGLIMQLRKPKGSKSIDHNHIFLIPYSNSRNQFYESWYVIKRYEYQCIANRGFSKLPKLPLMAFLYWLILRIT